MFSKFRRILSCIRGRLMNYDWQIENNFRSLYESVPVGFSINDLETGRFIRVNPAFCNIVGYSSEELLKMTYWDITPDEYEDDEHEQIGHMNNNGTYGPYEKQYIHKDGHLIPVLLSGTIIRDGINKPVIWSVVQDIAEMFEARKVIYELAYFDQLTGLPNRTHFINHTQVLVDRARKHGNKSAFFLLDVDDFKRINDSQGHSFGDKVLVEVASLMSSFVNARHSIQDDCQCFCARLGGDEFVVVVENFDTIDEIDVVAEEMHHIFSEPLEIDDQKITVSVSIGISIYPTDATTVSSIMKAADLALHAAKEYNRGSYYFHNHTIKTRFNESNRYEQLIADMVATGNIDVHFQPIYDVKKQKIIGAEALLRTVEDVYGPLNLGVVIEVAEQTGLIVDLGELVFQRACEECVKCSGLGPDRIVSINVSLRQLNDPEFVDMYRYIMSEVGVNPKNVALEVTESTMMTDRESVAKKLREMQEMGMKIYIDDFGKGYSSMSHLRNLPADKLKIDMAFISELEHDNTSVEIVRGINNLAHSLDMVTCAEGVETEAQLRILSKLGVDQIQGYLIGKPVPVGTFKRMHVQEDSND